MPHWINLSFYSTNKKVGHSNFIPRIKLPPKKPLQVTNQDNVKPKLIQEEEILPNSVFDYDAYDAQVFQLPTVPSARYEIVKLPISYLSFLFSLKIYIVIIIIIFFCSEVKTVGKLVYKKGSVAVDGPDPHKLTRKLSDPDIHHLVSGSPTASPIMSGSVHSTSLSIPIGSPSICSMRQCMLNVLIVKYEYIFISYYNFLF